METIPLEPCKHKNAYLFYPKSGRRVHISMAKYYTPDRLAGLQEKCPDCEWARWIQPPQPKTNEEKK